MDETRITANLPSLDIEIVRRRHPAEQAEVLSVSMKATPSFEAFLGVLATPQVAPLALFWGQPLMAWTRLIEAAWAPWLGGLLPGRQPPGGGS